MTLSSRVLKMSARRGGAATPAKKDGKSEPIMPRNFSLNEGDLGPDVKKVLEGSGMLGRERLPAGGLLLPGI